MIKKEKDIYRVQKGNNYSLYTKNGVKHNLNGPALIIDGDEWYYIKGVNYTWTQWTDYVSLFHGFEKQQFDIEKKQFELAEETYDGISIDLKEKRHNL